MHLGESGTGSTASSSPTASPAWPLIHFEVSCARCGHGLRGQTEPVCPACKLEFSWEQAAPLEHLTCGKCNYHLYGIADSRCPECGTSVDWNEALLRYRRREKPLFEYRWRDRPIRSFFYTWLHALRPKRLWRTTKLHDPPDAIGLFLWMVLLIALAVTVYPFCAALRWLAFNILYYSQELSARQLVSLIVFGFHEFRITLDRIPFLLLTAIFVPWWLSTLGGILILRQSLRSCRVRFGHVVRLCSYSLFVPLPVIALLTGMRLLWVPFWWNAGVHAFEIVLERNILTLCLVAAFVLWSLQQGIRHYLRLPHSLAIAIATQCIAVPVTLLIPTAISWARHWNELWNL